MKAPEGISVAPPALYTEKKVKESFFFYSKRFLINFLNVQHCFLNSKFYTENIKNVRLRSSIGWIHIIVFLVSLLCAHSAPKTELDIR